MNDKEYGWIESHGQVQTVELNLTINFTFPNDGHIITNHNGEKKGKEQKKLWILSHDESMLIFIILLFAEFIVHQSILSGRSGKNDFDGRLISFSLKVSEENSFLKTWKENERVYVYNICF